MTTDELYKQFQKELKEKLKCLFSKKFSDINNMNIFYMQSGNLMFQFNYNELAEPLIKSYSIRMFEPNLQFYQSRKDDFLEIIANNFMAQFLDKIDYRIESFGKSKNPDDEPL